MLKRSIRIASAFGIGIFVHWTFILIPIWITASTLLAGADLEAVLWANLFVALIFVCILLHELGHSLAARALGIGTRHITILPIGGIAALERMPRRPLHEAAVTIAGPAVNFLIAGILLAACAIFDVSTDPETFLDPGTGLLPSLLYANLLIGCFNLLPIFPMDGGRIFRAALSARKGHIRGTVIAARSGQVLALGLGALSVYGNPFLILLAAFLIVAAEAERRAAIREGREVEKWLLANDRTQFTRSFGEGRVTLLLPAPAVETTAE